ncbi:MAG: YraN family protein [Phycisphaerae bacterium]|nr:YraN family protein [Phycisphaerae bacterium]
MWPFTRRRAAESGESLGEQGEKLAARFLRRLKYKPIAANYRCPAGEADLIVLDTSTRRQTGQETIVFVEVKTRRDAANVSPESAVDAAKRRHLRQVARHYLAGRDTQGFAVRFDIIAILLPPGEQPRITHIRNAFGLRE